jgi:Fanconi anemia group M protein
MKEIFSIFSRNEKDNKETRIIEKPRVIIDYREKNCSVPSELIALGLEIEFQNLKVGDYLINEIIIERKSVNDFINSFINKRIFRQIEEIKQYPKFLLVIEGMEEQELYNDEKEGMNGNAIRGVLLSIILKYRIPVIMTKNQKDTAKFMNILARKQKKEHISLNAKKKSFNSQEQKQFILESFPGIGPATAKKLLKEFHTIKNILNQPIDELKKTIGKKAEIFKLVE